MRNSTLYRNLSEESIAFFKELKSEYIKNNKDSNNDSKQSQKEELDYLWQTLKIPRKEDKSAGLYIFTGFILGALSMFLMTSILSVSDITQSLQNDNGAKIVKKEDKNLILPTDTIDVKAIEEEQNLDEETEADDVPIIPIKEEYTVKYGDSLESIAFKYYGKSSPETREKISKANNLKSPDQILEGQKLIIPME